MLACTSWKDQETELAHLNDTTCIQCVYYRKFKWELFLWKKVLLFTFAVCSVPPRHLRLDIVTAA